MSKLNEIQGALEVAAAYVSECNPDIRQVGGDDMSDDWDCDMWYECPSCGAQEEAWLGAPPCTAYRCEDCDDDRLVLMRWNDEATDSERVV